jgi:hypothetical protein
MKKKKTRANRVGMGAISEPTGSSMPAPTSKPVSVPAADSPSNSTKDAAAEAARRAEDFMNQKLMQQANAVPPEPAPAVPTYDEVPSLRPTASTDTEVAEAQRAAQEAKSMAKKGTGFMGGFFKGFSQNSQIGLPGSGGHRSSPATVMNTASSLPAHSGMLNHVDTITQQQQEMKRAIDKRQLSSLQQVKSDDSEDVVVSTSVRSFQPPSVAAAVEKTTTSVFFKPAEPSKPVVVTPKAAPKKKTQTQIFIETQARFAQSVQHTMEQVQAMREQRKTLVEERFVGLAKERLSEQQIAQTEAQLQVAVEAEEYELADQLGQVVDAHKREQMEVASVMESITQALDQLEGQKTLVVQGVANCFSNLAFQLQELQKSGIIQEEKDDGETLKKFASISKQLSVEQERLQQDLKHLERDEQLVAEERKELETAISEQSGEYERQQDTVKKKLHKVEDEIEELRKQLAAKQASAADLRTEMHGLDDSISRVRVKFSRQLTRVTKKERALSENRNEWEAEQGGFKIQKEAHEHQVQSHSEALLTHDELMGSLKSELTLAKEFTDMVSEQLGIAEHEEDEGNLAQLQADVVKCEAAVSEAKVMLKAATAAIRNLEAEHEVLVKNIPDLESVKKAAATKRDFKTASKASKEIKDATTRLAQVVEELMGSASEKKTAAEEELQKLDEELGKTREIAQEEEKVTGMKKMIKLTEKIQQLVSTKAVFCGDSKDNNTVRGVGASVLNNQMQAYKAEGKALGSKYGGWTELMAEINQEEEEQTPQDGHHVSATEEIAASEEKEEPATEEKDATPPPDDGLTTEERIAKVRQILKRLKEAEEAVEAAASREAFDHAAELQEVFQGLQSELENINLTDDEMELAFAEDDGGDEAPKEQKDEEPATEEALEAKQEDDQDESPEAEEGEHESEANAEEPETIERAGVPDSEEKTDEPDSQDEKPEAEEGEHESEANAEEPETIERAGVPDSEEKTDEPDSEEKADDEDDSPETNQVADTQEEPVEDGEAQREGEAEVEGSEDQPEEIAPEPENQASQDEEDNEDEDADSRVEEEGKPTKNGAEPIEPEESSPDEE